MFGDWATLRNCDMRWSLFIFILVMLSAGCIESETGEPGGMDRQLTEAKVLKNEITVEFESYTNSLGMEFRLIPAGEFLMGGSKSPKEMVIATQFPFETAYFANQFPQHTVRITRPFYVGTTEVTQGQYVAVMNARPWIRKDFVKEGSDYPATYVDWDHAVEFCRRLSAKEGREYRLPTEAEWEYACRGGVTTLFCFGDDTSRWNEYAWFHANTRAVGEKYPHKVAQKKPNAFGLYDAHGNAWEWCGDWYAGDYYQHSPVENPFGPRNGTRRVYRGGCWSNEPAHCLSSYRYGLDPTYCSFHLGFRVVCVPSAKTNGSHSD